MYIKILSPLNLNILKYCSIATGTIVINDNSTLDINNLLTFPIPRKYPFIEVDRAKAKVHIIVIKNI